MTDLTSHKWIVAKGVMFALIVVMSAVGIIVYDDRWQRLGLLVICLWAACRFYYFLFYVLERYVGLGGGDTQGFGIYCNVCGRSDDVNRGRGLIK